MGIEFMLPALTRGNDVASGIETFPRDYDTRPDLSLFGSGYMHLGFVTATKAAAVTKALTRTDGVAAGATPTLCRIGVYEVNAAGGGTLVASTANDTALWSATYTSYSTNLSATYNVKLGQRYAIGALCVSGAAMPRLLMTSPITHGTSLPRVSMWIPSLTDLPASFVDGDLQDSPRLPWIALIA
jgi:hypothetical protein